MYDDNAIGEPAEILVRRNHVTPEDPGPRFPLCGRCGRWADGHHLRAHTPIAEFRALQPIVTHDADPTSSFPVSAPLPALQFPPSFVRPRCRALQQTSIGGSTRV